MLALSSTLHGRQLAQQLGDSFLEKFFNEYKSSCLMNRIAFVLLMLGLAACTPPTPSPSKTPIPEPGKPQTSFKSAIVEGSSIYKQL